jgi:hypothetical protein
MGHDAGDRDDPHDIHQFGMNYEMVRGLHNLEEVGLPARFDDRRRRQATLGQRPAFGVVCWRQTASRRIGGKPLLSRR